MWQLHYITICIYVFITIVTSDYHRLPETFWSNCKYVRHSVKLCRWKSKVITPRINGTSYVESKHSELTVPRVVSGWCIAICEWNELIQSGCAMASCQWTSLVELEHGELSMDGLGRVGAWRVVNGRGWSSLNQYELSSCFISTEERLQLLRDVINVWSAK